MTSFNHWSTILIWKMYNVHVKCSGLLLCFPSASCFYPADNEVNSNKCTDPNGLQREKKLESILFHKYTLNMTWYMANKVHSTELAVIISYPKRMNQIIILSKTKGKNAIWSSQESKFSCQTSNFSVLHCTCTCPTGQLNLKKVNKTCPG